MHAEIAAHALIDVDSTRRREAAATGGENPNTSPIGTTPGLYSDSLHLSPGPAPPAGRVESTLCVLRSSAVEISSYYREIENGIELKVRANAQVQKKGGPIRTALPFVRATLNLL